MSRTVLLWVFITRSVWCRSVKKTPSNPIMCKASISTLLHGMDKEGIIMMMAVLIWCATDHSRDTRGQRRSRYLETIVRHFTNVRLFNVVDPNTVTTKWTIIRLHSPLRCVASTATLPSLHNPEASTTYTSQAPRTNNITIVLTISHTHQPLTFHKRKISSFRIFSPTIPKPTSTPQHLQTANNGILKSKLHSGDREQEYYHQHDRTGFERWKGRFWRSCLRRGWRVWGFPCWRCVALRFHSLWDHEERSLCRGDGQ